MIDTESGEAALLKILKECRRRAVADIVECETGPALNDTNLDRLNRFHTAIAAVEATISPTE